MNTRGKPLFMTHFTANWPLFLRESLLSSVKNHNFILWWKMYREVFGSFWLDWTQYKENYAEKKNDGPTHWQTINLRSEPVHLQTHLFPLGYWTTISWSSSMPHTVPVVVSVSNMPSVHPPWPCWRDWTISRSKSMLTRSPIWRPPGFLLPFCSPGR